VPEQQVAALGQDVVEAADEVAGGVAGEVDGHVAADDQVDLTRPERRGLGHQVVQSQVDQPAHLVAHCERPATCRLEPAVPQHRGGSLDRAAGVDAAARRGKRLSRDVGSDDAGLGVDAEHR
jgi:hypothetical protein